MGLQAGDIMQSKVRTVRADSTLVELERAFCESKLSGFPVVDRDKRLVGVVSRTDIVRKLATEQSWAEYESAYYQDLSAPSEEPLDELATRVGVRLEESLVKDVMSHDPVTVTRGASLQEVAATMSERRIHRLPVVDGDQLVGIVTTMDIARLLAEGRIG